MRPIRLLLPLAVTAASLVALTQSSAATSSSVPSFGHVFVIVGENKSLFQLNSSNAPYILNTLKPASAWLTDYNATVKGSLADYVALTSGQFAPCQTKGPCGKFDVPSIFSQLGNGGWKDWNESMPTNCHLGASGSTTSFNAYKPGHNPALYYTGLPCSTYDVPTGGTGPNDMSGFNNALAAGNMPRYNFVSPNLCEDSYHTCTGNIVTEYNNFLKKEIPLIEASPAFGSDGVIFVTYDEGYVPTKNPNTMMAVVGPQVQPGTYSGHYDHYSTVLTTEQGLGLPCIANACSDSTLPVFGGAPPPTVSITKPTDGSTATGTVDVTGTAAAQGGASISKVQVGVDSGSPQPATGTTNWSTTLDTSGLAGGTHTITATATDSNGRNAAARITIDVGQPAACPAAPPGGTERSGNVSVEGSQSGWTGRYNAKSRAVRFAPAGGSYDGSWALQVGISSGAGQVGVNNANPVWVTSTTAGATYTGSSFVKASVAGEKLALTLTEKKAGGTTVGYHATAVTLNDTNWHRLSDPYTARGAGNVLRYSLHAYLASTARTFAADCLSLQTST